MTSLWRDLISAARALRRQPLFAGSTILTLGLGLGVVTGFFAIVEAVLLTPIAAHRETVVRVWKLDPQRSIDRFPLSYPELALWRERVQGVQEIAAVHYADTADVALFAGDESIPVNMAPVSAGFFSVLQDGPPLLGRWLLPSDDGNRVEVGGGRQRTLLAARRRRESRLHRPAPALAGRRARARGRRCRAQFDDLSAGCRSVGPDRWLFRRRQRQSEPRPAQPAFCQLPLPCTPAPRRHAWTRPGRSSRSSAAASSVRIPRTIGR